MKHRKFFLIYQRETLNKQNSLCEDLLSLEKQMKQMIMQIISREKKKVFSERLMKSCNQFDFRKHLWRCSKRNKRKYFWWNCSKEKEEVFDLFCHGLYSGFNNIKELPLKGKTIVITRTIEQSQESAAHLTNLGANVMYRPYSWNCSTIWLE